MAHPTKNNGVQMLRRGFNYTDGSDGLGRLDAGLFFIAFVVDARTHYVPMQSAMAKNDLLAEYCGTLGRGSSRFLREFNPGSIWGRGSSPRNSSTVRFSFRTTGYVFYR